MRKQLFHYSQINNYQFVTFRTKASVDDFLIRIKDSNIDESLKQLKIDQYLDQSGQGRLLNDDIISLTIKYCRKLDQEFYKLFCLSVMPNHIHILFEQKQDMKIIMQKLKGGLAFQINKKLGLSGSLWERGYFDKSIRDEKHFEGTYDYIKNNAFKAKLQDARARFYGIYA